MMKNKKVKIILTIITAVIILAGASLAIPQVRDFLFTNNTSDNNVADGDQEETADLSEVERREVGQATYKGDSSTVADIYDQSITGATSNKDKVSLYIKKAEALSAMNDSDGARAALESAVSIAPNDLGVVTFAATLYQMQGDNSKAALYNRQAAGLVKEIEQSGGYVVVTSDEYIQRAEELEK